MAKVINAVFGGGLFATTAKVFQYDVGDKLRFLGVDLPAGYSVDFANSRTGASTTVLGDADGVEIPPEYFIPGTDIYAWVVISDSDGHYTRYQAKIPIYERAARTSVEPTPAQADALDEAINALNNAVEDVQDIADNLNAQINAALTEAKESGEFDGPPGPQGPAGPQGQRGEQGPAGPSGEDGYSPTVTVSEIDGGHRVTITDEDGDHTFDVMDGQGGSGGGGLTDDIKQALLQLAQKVAYIDDQGETYYQYLYDALYPPKTVVSITAEFEQGSTVIYDDTALNDLKQYLTVTARYDDNTTAIIADNAYTLSGSLEAPASTVTVTYNGVTTTFSVPVTARPALSSISATYTQSGTVYDTDTLDSLKANLVVTAVYSDSSTQTVPAADYTLSGTLTVGTSTITVSYGGKATTFDVTVEKASAIPIYEWDLTQSLIDKITGLVATTTATQGSTGLVFDAANQYCDFGAVYQSGRTYELDILSVSTPGTHNVRRLFMADIDNDTAYGGGSGIIYGRNGTNWGAYSGSGWLTIVDNQMAGIDFFNGKTLRVYVDENMIWYIYAKATGSNDPFVLVGTTPSAMKTYTNGHVFIGGSRDDGIAPAVFTGLRVYEGEIE